MWEEDNLAAIKKIWKKGEGKAISAQGASGGILTWWDWNLFKFISAIENRHWLFVELESLETWDIFWIENVYVCTNHGSIKEFWTQLEQQSHSKMHLPCIIVGDFNATIS